MKKIILSLLVLMASVASVQAQDLFKTVRDNATKVVNNPASSDEEIQINQFKVTALNYLSMMVQKRGLKTSRSIWKRLVPSLPPSAWKSSKFIQMPASSTPCSRTQTRKEPMPM